MHSKCARIKTLFVLWLEENENKTVETKNRDIKTKLSWHQNYDSEASQNQDFKNKTLANWNSKNKTPRNQSSKTRTLRYRDSKNQINKTKLRINFHGIQKLKHILDDIELLWYCNPHKAEPASAQVRNLLTT